MAAWTSGQRKKENMLEWLVGVEKSGQDVSEPVFAYHTCQ